MSGPPPADQKTLASTAFHEAGHAAVAHYLGLRLNVVRIGLEPDFGYTECAPALRSRRRGYATMNARRFRYVDLAGPLAEQRHLVGSGTEFEVGDLPLTSSDFDVCHELLRRSDEFDPTVGADGLTGGGRRFLEDLATTDALVREVWSGVGRLAQALLVEREITGDDAAKLLCESGVQFGERFELMRRAFAEQLRRNRVE